MPILRAELQDNEGNWIARDIDLAERIGNNDGQFLFGKESSWFPMLNPLASLMSFAE
jgi:hypothetical protein